MITDPIADFIVRIKNAGDAGKDTVLVPYSRLKESIATVLEKQGFLKSVTKKGKKVNKFLEIGLIYNGNTPKVQGVLRVSHLSKRVYQKARDIRSFRSGFGNIILSTPKGILTDVEARKHNVGGEVLFKIW
jgi:small subunit ribosomal protein S8